MKLQAILSILLISSNILLANDYYVSTVGNDETGNGTKQSPFKSLEKSFAVIEPAKDHILHIGEGVFSLKKQILVPSGIHIMGAGIGKTIIKCENFFDIETTAKKGRDYQVLPVLDPRALETASLVFKGKNQRIEGLEFDGSNKQTIAPILILYGENLVFDTIYAHDFKVSGWWLHEGKNVTLKNSKFKNNSFGNFNQDYGAVMFHRADDLFIHDNLIDETDTHSYGIKMASKDQCNMWSCKNEWTDKTVNDNINIFNNIIKVSENGSWGVPGKPNTKVPSITIEFNSNIECRAKIYNNWLNNTVSIVASEMGQQTSYEVFNNLVDLRNADGSNKYAYFIETNQEHFNIHHNLVIGGFYPFSSWDKNKERNKDCLIHHNIFYSPQGRNKELSFFTYGSGFDGYQFYNNTVIDTKNIKSFFEVRNPERCNQNAAFKNNIFYAITPRGDIMGDSCAFNGVIDNNLFYNIAPKGNRSHTFNPKLNFKGSLDNIGYYALKAKSKAIDAGIVIEGITDKYVGSAPDLGAIEYGAKPFVVGVIDFKQKQ